MRDAIRAVVNEEEMEYTPDTTEESCEMDIGLALEYQMRCMEAADRGEVIAAYIPEK